MLYCALSISISIAISALPPPNRPPISPILTYHCHCSERPPRPPSLTKPLALLPLPTPTGCCARPRIQRPRLAPRNCLPDNCKQTKYFLYRFSSTYGWTRLCRPLLSSYPNHPPSDQPRGRFYPLYLTHYRDTTLLNSEIQSMPQPSFVPMSHSPLHYYDMLSRLTHFSPGSLPLQPSTFADSKVTLTLFTLTRASGGRKKQNRNCDDLTPNTQHAAVDHLIHTLQDPLVVLTTIPSISPLPTQALPRWLFSKAKIPAQHHQPFLHSSSLDSHSRPPSRS